MGITHVPMCIYWKRQITPVISNAIVSQMDLFASLGQLIGANGPDGLASKALMPAFPGEDTIGRQDLTIENQGKFALRSRNYVFMPLYED